MELKAKQKHNHPITRVDTYQNAWHLTPKGSFEPSTLPPTHQNTHALSPNIDYRLSCGVKIVARCLPFTGGRADEKYVA